MVQSLLGVWTYMEFAGCINLFVDVLLGLEVDSREGRLCMMLADEPAGDGDGNGNGIGIWRMT